MLANVLWELRVDVAKTGASNPAILSSVYEVLPSPVSLVVMFGFSAYSLMGFCLGFMLGVGCALAVMYSIFLGGYRAALADMLLEKKPTRWLQEKAKAETSATRHGGR